MPRLGLQLAGRRRIVVKGEQYFALTSEAMMAGGRLRGCRPSFGPGVGAASTFGADGIVYFDPFRYEVDVYASISAGVTIDIWIGEITISISIGAQHPRGGARVPRRGELRTSGRST